MRHGRAPSPRHRDGGPSKDGFSLVSGSGQRDLLSLANARLNGDRIIPYAPSALLREGETAGGDPVARLMRENGIQGAKRRGKPWLTTIADPQARKSPDLVHRDFTAVAPDRLWVGDFTYLRAWEGGCSSRS